MERAVEVVVVVDLDNVDQLAELSLRVSTSKDQISAGFKVEILESVA